MAVTALGCRRHASAQMIVKPQAMPGICGAMKPRPPATTVHTTSGQSRLSTTAPGRCSGIIVAAFASASRRPMAGATAARRPTNAPMSAATPHHAAVTMSTFSSSVRVAARAVTAASVVAAPALRYTVVLSRSVKRIWPGPLGGERLEQAPHAGSAVDQHVGLGGDVARGLVVADAHADRLVEAPRGDQVAQRAEGVEVGAVVADVQRDPHGEIGEQALDALALVHLDGRADLEDLVPAVGDDALRLGGGGAIAHRSLGGLLVGRAAPVEGGDRLLVLGAHAQA